MSIFRALLDWTIGSVMAAPDFKVCEWANLTDDEDQP